MGEILDTILTNFQMLMRRPSKTSKSLVGRMVTKTLVTEILKEYTTQEIIHLGAGGKNLLVRFVVNLVTLLYIVF